MPPLDVLFRESTPLTWAAAWMLAARWPDRRIGVLGAPPAPDVSQPTPDGHQFGGLRESRTRLERFCQEHGVERERCGRLHLAGREETARLHDLYRAGLTSGGNGLLVTTETLREKYPWLMANQALLDVDGGWIDAAALARAFAELACRCGVETLTEPREAALTVRYAGFGWPTAREERPAIPGDRLRPVTGLLTEAGDAWAPWVLQRDDRMLSGPHAMRWWARWLAPTRGLARAWRRLDERFPRPGSTTARSEGRIRPRWTSGPCPPRRGATVLVPGEPDLVWLFDAADEICRAVRFRGARCGKTARRDL